MLLPELLITHPGAIVDIVRQTPAWVGALFTALLWLGFSATRNRDVAPVRLVALPAAMACLALWGVLSAFSASGQLAALLALWVGCFAALLAWGPRLPVPDGTAWNAATRRFHLPGSWAPMGLILAVFLLKYGMGVQLAMAPQLARHGGFALAVTALYGLLSGLFAARTLRVLRLATGASTPHVRQA
ncbi:MAG: DUF6622 family protein [Comamonas sp.]|nr:hypothetical protein [Comamonas sp.]